MSTNRRAFLAASAASAAGLAAPLLGATPAAADAPHGAPPTGRGRNRPSVLVATNEPWGTYHVEPLLAEAERRGWRITQLVPDRSRIEADDPVPVAEPADAPPANLLVVTGAEEWPLTCADRFARLPLAASSLAYLGPERAEHAGSLRGRIRTITAGSPAEGRSFGGYLGTRRRIRVVGSPQTDDLPQRAPESDLVLILTSVTHPDEGGGAAPGTELLLAAAERLSAQGKRILVGLHPREDPSLWDRYEISDRPSAEASARAEVALGIPGTVFPLVAAVGTPLVGVVDPELEVPDYLLSVCSSTVDDVAQVSRAVAEAEPPDAETLTDAVGPIGGSAARLLDVWGRAASPIPR